MSDKQKLNGVSPAARMWVYAQKETNKASHVEGAKSRSWVSFDNVSPETIQEYLYYLQNMKANNLLNRVLVSQDAGWYNVGKPKGGKYRDYNTIFDIFIPALKKTILLKQKLILFL